ncbi:18822_t:CDS:1, partial [Rhizophagus irregularis]
IRDVIKAKKLFDSIFTECEIRNTWPFNEFLKQELYKTIPKKLRDYGSKHAFRIHGGKNPTPQHLKLLLRIALRQESDYLDAGDNYAIGDTESKDSGPESDHEFVSKASDSPKPQIQASSPASQPNPQCQAKRKSQQTMDIDSMLAEIDAMLAEIWK